MKDTLQKLGLDEKEAVVYLACLTENPSTPTQISKATSLKRATVYFYVEKLQEKGLLTHEIRGAKKYISALAPKQALKRYIAAKKEKITEEELLLRDLVTSLKEHPLYAENGHTKVLHLEGTDGITHVLNKILDTKKDMYWLGSLDTLLSQITEKSLYNMFASKRLKHGTSSYAITNTSIQRYPQFSTQIGNQRHFRFLPVDFTIPGVLVLFGNNLCIISKEQRVIKIVLVENATMCSLVHFLFMSLWKNLSK